jgi:hypothetical protein
MTLPQKHWACGLINQVVSINDILTIHDMEIHCQLSKNPSICI